jgi:hypothetical protein
MLKQVFHILQVPNLIASNNCRPSSLPDFIPYSNIWAVALVLPCWKPAETAPAAEHLNQSGWAAGRKTTGEMHFTPKCSLKFPGLKPLLWDPISQKITFLQNRYFNYNMQLSRCLLWITQ